MTGQPGRMSPFQDQTELGTNDLLAGPPSSSGWERCALRTKVPISQPTEAARHEVGRMVSETEDVAEQLYRWERVSGVTFLDPGR
jgi:hypothetical protein